ncbi:MAG: hypothetical protein TIS_01326 [Tissierella sp.]
MIAAAKYRDNLLHFPTSNTRNQKYIEQDMEDNLIDKAIEDEIKKRVYEHYIRDKNILEVMLEQMELFNDMVNKIEIGHNTKELCKDNCLKEKEKLIEDNDHYKEENFKLTKELETMNKKMQHLIHYPSIIFMIGSTVVFTCFAMTIYSGLFKSIWLLHPYYSITGAIAALGIFLTSLKGFNVWRERIIGKGK